MLVLLFLAGQTLYAEVCPMAPNAPCFIMNVTETSDNHFETCFSVEVDFNVSSFEPGQTVEVIISRTDGTVGSVDQSCNATPCLMEFCIPKKSTPYEINIECVTKSPSELGCTQRDGCIVIIGG